MSTFTALVLAASRTGAENPVAQLQNISHKCLVVIDGMVMLHRVVDVLRRSPSVGRIVISIESDDIVDTVPELKALRAAGEIETVRSADNLFSSVLTAVETIADPYPLLISTADNALHTPEMIEHFCRESQAAQCDAGIGMTPAQMVLDAYPEGMRAFHNLKDEGWSSCNLYALMNGGAIKAAKAFETGGQFGKKPSRILKAFGLKALIQYKFRLVTIDGVAATLSRRFGIEVSIIRMPFAEGPIDVDNPGDFNLTEKILIARRQAQA